jgi:hypothetical protein
MPRTAYDADVTACAGHLFIDAAPISDALLVIRLIAAECGVIGQCLAG